MSNITWVRWKHPLLIFLVGLTLISSSTNKLSFALFKHDVESRLQILYTFYQGRYLTIDKEIYALADKMTFTCNDKDIELMRETIESSPAIQLLELQLPNTMCSIYGSGAELIKSPPSNEMIIEKNFKLEAYFNNRLKVTISTEHGSFIAITEPFEHIFLQSEVCQGCFAVDVNVDDQYLTLYGRDENTEYRYVASQQFSKRIHVNIYSTDAGIQRMAKSGVIFIQSALIIILLLSCLLFGLLKSQRRNLKDMITIGLKNKEFIPFYQPIIDSSNETIIGCEVLVRWQKRNGEIISPNQFIPIAEHNGQIFDLTYHLLHQVARDLNTIVTIPDSFYASLNVVPEQLETPNFADNVFRILALHKVAPRTIAFEVTERTPFSNLQQAEAVISKLKQRGIEIKLDDAGTGYGGFSYLQALPIDTLKIDKMFVDTIGTDDVKSKILSSIILFGQNAGLKMIAEGVETKEQIAYLNQKGITLIQGYYYSKPLPFSEFVDYCEKHVERPHQSRD
jgi:sensor c-di-GMP phosphodiesterase-like protein